MTNTVVRFVPKPTCVQQHNCEDCAALRASTSFACAWCPKARRCSDGADRMREHWDAAGCAASNVTGTDACGDDSNLEWRSSVLPEPNPSNGSGGLSFGVILSAIISSLLIVILLLLLLGYVYVFGKSHPGGTAERLALRLESGYRRFGGIQEAKGSSEVELGRTPSPQMTSNEAADKQTTNNNSITVSF